GVGQDGDLQRAREELDRVHERVVDGDGAGGAGDLGAVVEEEVPDGTALVVDEQPVEAEDAAVEGQRAVDVVPRLVEVADHKVDLAARAVDPDRGGARGAPDEVALAALAADDVDRVDVAGGVEDRRHRAEAVDQALGRGGGQVEDAVDVVGGAVEGQRAEAGRV